jgi:hypothetical protein
VPFRILRRAETRVLQGFTGREKLAVGIDAINSPLSLFPSGLWSVFYPCKKEKRVVGSVDEKSKMG